jgi:hypothetical protein
MPVNPRLFAYAALGVAGATAAVAVGAFTLGPHTSAASSDTARAEATPINARVISGGTGPTYGLLDGVALTDQERQAKAGTAPVAVMVDNYTDARPQYGLGRAELVQEALVEYGITRFEAVYWRNDAPRIEPVRSARTQFLGLALELGATYTHVGSAAEEGPANAEAQMRDWGVHQVDEEAGGAIKRDPGRVAPYNAMTSTAALQALAAQRGWTAPAPFTSWSFKADGGAPGTPVSVADMDFDADGGMGGAFAVRWQYDADTNTYLRSEGGAPHIDAATGEQLTAKNVVLQFSEVRPAGDRAGHVLYSNEGSGRATILLDGKAINGAWHKDGHTGRTRYFDASGREISFNRGATWVEMLPTTAPVTLK